MSVSLVIVVQNIQDGKLEFDRIVSGIVEKRSIYYLLLISNIKQNLWTYTYAKKVEQPN